MFPPFATIYWFFIQYTYKIGNISVAARGPDSGAWKIYCFCRCVSGSFEQVKVMQAHITVITLGVEDLERSLRFYRDGLGLKTNGIVGQEYEHGAVAFFDLQPGIRLALWPRSSTAHDTGLPPHPPSATDLTLEPNVSSKLNVDALMRIAQQAGATIVKPAQDTFWGGYAGYFQDPDGHVWEIVWNPDWV